MKINDLDLQRHYDRAVIAVTGLPKDLLPIFGLMDAYGWFKQTEGEDSPRVQEIIRLLSSSELRAPLKAWYLRHNKINVAANRFRQILEGLTGEELPLGK